RPAARAAMGVRVPRGRRNPITENERRVNPPPRRLSSPRACRFARGDFYNCCGMAMKTIASAVLACVTAVLVGATAHAAGFTDVLSQPAAMSPLASKGLLQGVARA